MTTFVTGITDIVTGIFGSLVTSLSSISNVIFVVSEAGAITGVSPFGWLLVVGISVPLATWLFGKFFTFIRGIGKGGK